MQVEKLIEIIRKEKKCTYEEASQVAELLGFANGRDVVISDELIKRALELWEAQFGQSKRNFGLSLNAFESMLARLKAGDQSLFEHVFLNHFNACVNFLIHQRNIPRLIAEDAAMDTLLVFRQMMVDGKVEYDNLRFLFTRMAVFTAQKMLNKDNRIDPLETMQNMQVAEPEGVDKESIRILGDALKKLGDECRQILRGFYYDSQSWKDMAELLQITEENARKKGQRCRDALKKLL